MATNDSPRWCEHCQAWGSHHTDKHSEHVPEPKAMRIGDQLWLPSVLKEPESDVIVCEPDGYTIVLCHCAEGPYLGARKAGTPCCCERCGFMTRDQWDALAAAARKQP